EDGIRDKLVTGVQTCALPILTHGHTPIVAFTRRRDTALKLSAYERGADDILEVPFTLDEIVARPFALMRRAHGIAVTIVPKIKRSEERRVGKECRDGRGREHR